MKYSSLFFSALCSFSNISKVFHRNREFFWTSVNNLFRDYVIYIFLKPSPISAYSFEFLTSRFGAFRLQITSKMLMLCHKVMQMLGAIKLTLRGNGQSIYSQIHTNTIYCFSSLRGRKFKNYIQKPLTSAVNQIRRTIFTIDEFLMKIAKSQRYFDSTFEGAKTDDTVHKINSARLVIVSNRTKVGSGFRNFLVFFFSDKEISKFRKPFVLLV